jgi:hypothetical protein
MLRKPKSVGKTRRAATGAKPKALKTQPASAPVRIDSGPQRPGSRKMSNNARPQSGMKASSYKRTSLGAKQSAEGQRAAEEIVGHREHIRELFREGTYAEYDAFQVVVLLGRMLAASPEAWRKFIAHMAWLRYKKDRPSETDRPNAVRFAIRLFKGPGDAASKKASLRWRAVQALNDVVADHELADWLKHFGGYTAAIKSAKAFKDEAGDDRARKKRSAMRGKAAMALTTSTGDEAAVKSTQRTPLLANLEPAAREIDVPVIFRLDGKLGGLFSFPEGQKGTITFTVVRLGKNPILRVDKCQTA